MTDRTRPAAGVALRDESARRAPDRRVDVLRSHVEPVDVVQPAIVGLAHDRQAPEGVVSVVPRDLVGDERVADDADAVRIGDRDRGGEHPGLSDPFQPGELSVPVQAMAAREDDVLPDPLRRQDHRHAGPDRTLASNQRTAALDQRRRADAHARGVGDRVQRTGRELPDGQPEIAIAGHRSEARSPTWGPPSPCARSTRTRTWPCRSSTSIAAPPRGACRAPWPWRARAPRRNRNRTRCS